MRRRGLLAGGAALVASLGLAPLAGARQVRKFAEELKNGEFNWFPERSATGPILIIVSIPDQRVHVYRNGIRIGASTCSTGKKGHETPTGIFQILQKDKDHKSATYDDAAMPNMNRLTWDGIALHAGKLPGYPASHGCVRLPMDFSELLFGVTQLGMTVVIADESTFPSTITHPGLVLDDAALGKFKAAQANILKREYAARQVKKPSITTVVVSSADLSMHILIDGKEIARGSVTIKGSAKGKLGERLYTLSGSDGDRKSMQWISADVGKSGKAAGDVLSSIAADPAIAERMRQNMHLGMMLILTDRPADAATRTGPGFRILTT